MEPNRLKQSITVKDEKGTRKYGSIADMLCAECMTSNEMQCVYYHRRDNTAVYRGKTYTWAPKAARHYRAEKDGRVVTANSQNELSRLLTTLEGRYISQGNIARTLTTNPKYHLTTVAGWSITEQGNAN